MHTTGGYSVQTYLTTKYVFDLREDDVYWCTADIGWVTGHSYVVYGPLQNGATVLMYEGAPNFPENDRFWKIIDDHKVSDLLHGADGDSRVHQVGRRVGAEALAGVAAAAGDGGRADQSRGVDVVSPRDRQGALPDCGYVVADGDGRDHDCADSGSGADEAGLGDAAVLRDCAGGGDEGGRAGAAGAGRAAGGAQAVAVDGADDLRRSGALSADLLRAMIPGSYFTGDGARRDADGYFWLMGRVDDVINVSGHRLGTMEVESALVAHPKVAEAAVVGRPDELKGQAIAAFVSLEQRQRAERGAEGGAAQVGGEGDWRAGAAGRSAVYRRCCRRRGRARSCAGCCGSWRRTGEVKGDTTTLEDFAVMAKLREGDE